MSARPVLFEVSFEVANKVGGIHTVLSTKARTVLEHYGDDYFCVGPWLFSESERRPPFDEEPGFEAFAASCREMGIPVRVGRWRVPGSPRAILVEFSGMWERKDGILTELWETHGVDSIEGGWDYEEPVLFGYAAGQVIERFWEEELAPRRRRATAHFHEWMTGAGLLHLKERCPAVGTVFTTHATMLGRALSSPGHSLGEGAIVDPDELARRHRVTAKHSLEGVCARTADVFTTVSELTAAEAELLHVRRANPLTPNGIDLSVIDEVAGPLGREETRTRLLQLASRLLGDDLTDAALLATSGRYEFHNKGIDLILDAMGRLQGRDGRRVVLFILVPAGNSGLSPRVRQRLAGRDGGEGPVGIATHSLRDPHGDPVLVRCRERGLDNALGTRVRVLQVPIYLDGHDELIGLPYEGVVRAMDLTLFPSHYEPWGYTPQESLALGVPTVTSDQAGFGRWALEEGLGSADGISVLERHGRTYESTVEALGEEVQRFLREGPSAGAMGSICQATASRTAWSGLFAHYLDAYRRAGATVETRLAGGAPLRRRVPRPVELGEPRDCPRPRLATFEVEATLPESLMGLAELARNFWWCWDPEGRTLFEELSPASWESARHNPVLFLRRVFRDDLEARAADPGYVAKLGRVVERFRADLARDQGQWCEGVSPEHPVAYFCAEFGVHESLPVYSGGLGILAGDHLKSASDLALPLVAVGLFYRQGYFAQRLSTDGRQEVVELDNDPRGMALERVRDGSGEPVVVRLGLPGRELHLEAWRARVGRVDLYLLDADFPENRPEDRAITRSLYGGDQRTRIRQELVLGRGGARLLARLGIEPSVYHMNEGHAAFLALERVRHLMATGLDYPEARELVRATTAFTTHTPVPAGHDRFPHDLLRPYFADVAEWAGLTFSELLQLGHAEGDGAEFNMSYLALSFAGWVNGVSRLHGEVSRSLLAPFWPSLLESEVPIDSVTNGVHLPTWTGPEVTALLCEPGRAVRGTDFTDRAEGIELADLWSARRSAKARLIALARHRLRRAFVERDDSPRTLERVLEGLDDRALFIGFARRFAPYKRAHLLFEDLERLDAILADEKRPVRILVAGKAHPQDTLGQDILASVAAHARGELLAGKVIFLEDYDAELGRALVSGVDVWLNTPTRRMEASGTSGMKAAANGVLGLSIADGWWPEGADGRNGWTIAAGRVYGEQELQDQHDSVTLYRLLEEEIVPLFFERNRADTPNRWLERSRHALATQPAVFDSDRMVREYTDKAYLPLGRLGRELIADGGSGVSAKALRRARLEQGLRGVMVSSAAVGELHDLRVGEALEARVELVLGELEPEDVVVELVVGHARGEHDLVLPEAVELSQVAVEGERVVYSGSRMMERSGEYAFGLRLRPRAGALDTSGLRGLARWL